MLNAISFGTGKYCWGWSNGVVWAWLLSHPSSLYKLVNPVEGDVSDVPGVPDS